MNVGYWEKQNLSTISATTPLNARLVEETNCIPDDGPSRGLASAKFATSGLGELCGPIGAAAIPIYATFFPGSAREPLNRCLDGRSAIYSEPATR